MSTIPENRKVRIHLKKAKAELPDTQNVLRQLAFDNTAQANLIFNTSSGKVILANNTAIQLLGYSMEEIKEQSRATIFNTKEKSFIAILKRRKKEGSATGFATVTKKGGKQIQCVITSALFLDNNGVTKSITTITDISQDILDQKIIDIKKEKIVADNITLVEAKQKKIDKVKAKIVADNINLAKSKQKKIDDKNKITIANDIVIAKAKAAAILAASNLWKKRTGKASYDVMWDWDLVTDKIFVGDSVKEVFGYSIINNHIILNDFLNCLLPAEKENIRKNILRTLASKSKIWKANFMFKCQNGTMAFTMSRAFIIRNKKGKAVHVTGAIQDVTKLEALKIQLKEQQMLHAKEKQTAAEENLEFNIRLKEKQIADAMEEAKDAERADIGKELHDNINQLLGASRMYLEMAKRGGKNSKMYLSRSSKYMLTAIEEIRKLTKGLTTDLIKNLGLCVAIDNIIEEVMAINPVKIFSNLDNFNEEGMNDKFKLNIFRILQEQLNNIIKHAHAKAVRVDLSKNKNAIVLHIADDGIGFDMLKKQNGIGIANIKSRAASFNGKANFISTPSHGCALTATFPLPNMQPG